ncbi:MAG TPA: M48 family metalloprotease, partial [Candidatus Hodarchaeales archaeon]|nr:M48 family metalloprotease [Candidatus Hodarchaeales archaeon]
AIIVITSALPGLPELSIVMGIILAPTSLILFFFASRSHKELNDYAKSVGYVHFRSSYKDYLIVLSFQTFTTVFQGVLLFFALLTIKLSSTIAPVVLALATAISMALQSIYIFSSQSQKAKLFRTAQEPISQSLLSVLQRRLPVSKRVREFRFTDIKPASLFLSAGVSSSGRSSYACMISRYFQWKLNETELFAVLSHEVGHVANRDLTRTYLSLGTEGWVRIVRLFSVAELFLITSSQLLKLNDFIIVFGILFVGLLTSTSTQVYLKNRTLLQEINADRFGAESTGNYPMAEVLKKLPSTIPAPVDNNALGFLGFRIELLKHRAKSLGETLKPPERAGANIYKV